MRNFRDLTIWKDSIQLTKKVYLLSESLPSNEKYGLSNQICRAVVSIPSNIAEGCSRSSQKEFKHFLEIALGSAFEVETQLVIINGLKMIDSAQITEIINDVNKLQAQINSLTRKIKGESGKQLFTVCNLPSAFKKVFFL